METTNPQTESLWYYLSESKNVSGPLPLDEIKALVDSGILPPETQVCRAGEEQWHRLTIALLPPVPVLVPVPLPPLPLPVKPIAGKGIQEYRRSCRQCGKVWHSLVKREKEIQNDMLCNWCQGATQCCSSAASAQFNRNVSAQESEISRLRKCPECQSTDYHEEILTHDVPPPR